MACVRYLQAISDDNFHVGFNRIYDKNLARSLRNIFKKHVHLFKGLEERYDLDLAASCTSIRDFDDAITRRTFGDSLAFSISPFQSLQEYQPEAQADVLCSRIQQRSLMTDVITLKLKQVLPLVIDGYWEFNGMIQEP